MQKFYIKFTRDGDSLMAVPCYAHYKHEVENYADLLVQQMNNIVYGEVEYEIYDGEPDWATQMLV